MEQRKVYCKENRGLMLKRSKFSMGFRKKVFIGEIWDLSVGLQGV